MNRIRQWVVVAASMLCCLCATTVGQDFSGKDSTISRERADSIKATMQPDTGLEAKLAVAQSAWDRNTPQGQSPASPVSGASLGGLLLQVFASLAVLGMAAFALLFLLQRAKAKKSASAGSGGGMIDLLETKSVGPSRHVSMVRLHNRVVAVAFSGQSTTLLAEFSGNDAAEIIAESGTGKASIREFAATLDTLMDKFRSRAAEKQERPESLR